MKSTTKWWITVPLAAGFIVSACSSDDGNAATPAPTEEPAAAAAEPTDPPREPAAEADAPAAGIVMLGDEEMAIARVLCFFEEQPRAGLGGVFTHTFQAQGTNAAGEPVIVAVDRARDEDGTVGDEITVDIGDPGSEDAMGLRATGPEGLAEFGEASVAVSGVQVTDFEADSMMLSFDLACG